jgi:hypothetical protein
LYFIRCWVLLFKSVTAFKNEDTNPQSSHASHFEDHSGKNPPMPAIPWRHKVKPPKPPQNKFSKIFQPAFSWLKFSAVILKTEFTGLFNFLDLDFFQK